MSYELWREITVSVGAALGLLGFFRSQEHRKEQRFIELIRELSNPHSAMLRAAAASQLHHYFNYRRYGFFGRPFQHQALIMAIHGLKEPEEITFVRQELVNAMHQMLQKSDRKSFPRANLIDSKLDHLIMHGFSFDYVDLTQASLKECDLGLASFVGAKLWKAYLVGSNLSSANFTDAMLWDADLSNTNLEDATIIPPKIIKQQLSSFIVTYCEFGTGSCN